VLPRALALVSLLAFVLLAPRAAGADETAPELETHALRSEARSILAALVTTLTPEERARTVGVYLAVDANPTDPSALAACDDDGDYVVVVSDAMLRLIDHAARAGAIEDVTVSARKVAEYGAFLARSQRPNERLLPPPPGFFGGDAQRDPAELRRDALAFVLGRELEHVRARDVSCPHPTATKERGDDVWTAAEQRAAVALAARTYRADATLRDFTAAARLFAAGGSGRGALATLGVLSAIEQARDPRRPGAFAPSYLRYHPASAERMSTVRRARAAPASPDASAPGATEI
jgi:hypothetical protein